MTGSGELPFAAAPVDADGERYRLAVRASSDGFWDWSPAEGAAMWWSDGLLSLLGYGRGSVAPTWENFLSLQHSKDRKRWETLYEQHLNTRTAMAIELRLKGGNGGYAWYRLRARLLFDEEGGLQRVVGSVSDIDAQKQAEQLLRNMNEQLELRVAERTSALSHANASLRRSKQMLEEHNNYLKDFAAFASHDLREPLRKIRAYGDLLQDELNGQMNQDAQDYLGRMVNAAQRMERLIDDLLLYARSTGQNVKEGMVDLNAVVRNVASDLEIAFQETGVTLEVAQLPAVAGSQSQLRQVFQNLLANAVKYRDKQKESRIWVCADQVDLCPLTDSEQNSGRREHRYHRISVIDNGIGFEQRHADRVFLPFKRLNTRHEYPGSGIGLAVCRRVVERHEGIIYATSEPGIGTAVHILLLAEHDSAAGPPNSVDQPLTFTTTPTPT